MPQLVLWYLHYKITTKVHIGESIFFSTSKLLWLYLWFVLSTYLIHELNNANFLLTRFLSHEKQLLLVRLKIIFQSKITFKPFIMKRDKIFISPFLFLKNSKSARFNCEFAKTKLVITLKFYKNILLYWSR